MFIGQNKVVIPLKYDDACDFSSDDLALVCIGGKWGYINRTGKVVIPLIYDYAPCTYFDEGIAVVGIGDKWGCIDPTGKFLLPCEYDSDTAKEYMMQYIETQYDIRAQQVQKLADSSDTAKEYMMQYIEDQYDIRRAQQVQELADRVEAANAQEND